MVGTRLVDLAKAILVGARKLGGLCCATRKQVAADDAKVADQLAHLGIGKDEGCERAEVLRGLVGVGTRFVLVDRNDFIGVLLRARGIGVTRVPEEVLEELIRVLLARNEASGVEDFTYVLDKCLTRLGELVGGNGRMLESILKESIDLVVGRKTRFANGSGDAVEAKLAVDVSILPVTVDGVGDGAQGGAVADVLLCGWERHGGGIIMWSYEVESWWS